MPSAFLFSLWSVLFLLIPVLVAATGAIKTNNSGNWIEHTIQRASVGRKLNAAFYFCSWLSWWMLPRRMTISPAWVALAVITFSIAALALYLFLSRPEQPHALSALVVIALVDVDALALLNWWVGSGRAFTRLYRLLIIGVSFAAGAVGLVGVRLATRIAERRET